MAASYDYLSFELDRGRPAWAQFARHVQGTFGTTHTNDDGELLGLFAPQLGFASNEAVILLRRKTESRSVPQILSAAPGVKRFSAQPLHPTVRPRDEDMLKPGGIYVHRWFTIDGDRTADFVDLSNRAWGGFEGSYDTEIFGLFTAEPDEGDRQRGEARLLLLTWYRNHGVWEQSREQAHDTASLFAKRHELTRSTIGRSSLLAFARE